MENIEKYGIEIQLQKQRELFQSLNKLEKSLVKLNSNVYKSLERQQSKLGNTLNRVSKQNASQRIKIENSASKTLLADRLKNEQKISDKVEKEKFHIVQKSLDKREAVELKRLEKLARVDKSKAKEVADYKARLESRQRDQDKARFKQHIAGMTSNSNQGSQRITSKNSAFNLSDAEIAANKKKIELEKQQEKLLRGQARQQEKLKEAINDQLKGYRIRNSMTNKASEETERLHKAEIRRARSAKELASILKRQNIELAAQGREQRRIERSIQKQSYLQSRMTASAKQWAGTYVSAFAAVGALTSATRSGQAMEGAVSSINVMSESSKQAAENMEFVREEAYRLGKPLKESAKIFSQLLASRGNLELQQVKDIFSSTQEMAVVLGMNADATGRAMTAISQMMAKGKISSEELRQQLSESGMANAYKEMVLAAQDIGKIDKNLGLVEARQEFEKLLQAGAIMSEEIMPRFSERVREVSAPELGNKLKSNTVALGRFLETSLVDAGDQFFKAGWGEGFTELLNTLALSIKDLIPLFQSLGRVAGGTAKFLAKAIKLITPPLKVLGSLLNWVTEMFGDFSAIFTGVGGYLLVSRILGVTAATAKLAGATGVLASKASLMKKFWKVGWMAPIAAATAALIAFEDLANKLWYKDKIGADYDPRLDPRSDLYDKERAFKQLGENGKYSKDDIKMLLEKPSSPITDPLMWLKDAITLGFKPNDYGNMRDNFSVTSPQIVINHKTIIDGEEVASSVTKTDEFKNGVGYAVLPYMMGGQ